MPLMPESNSYILGRRHMPGNAITWIARTKSLILWCSKQLAVRVILAVGPNAAMFTLLLYHRIASLRVLVSCVVAGLFFGILIVYVVPFLYKRSRGIR